MAVVVSAGAVVVSVDDVVVSAVAVVVTGGSVSLGANEGGVPMSAFGCVAS